MSGTNTSELAAKPAVNMSDFYRAIEERQRKSSADLHFSTARATAARKTMSQIQAVNEDWMGIWLTLLECLMGMGGLGDLWSLLDTWLFNEFAWCERRYSFQLRLTMSSHCSREQLAYQQRRIVSHAHHRLSWCKFVSEPSQTLTVLNQNPDLFLL